MPFVQSPAKTARQPVRLCRLCKSSQHRPCFQTVCASPAKIPCLSMPMPFVQVRPNPPSSPCNLRRSSHSVRRRGACRLNPLDSQQVKRSSRPFKHSTQHWPRHFVSQSCFIVRAKTAQMSTLFVRIQRISARPWRLPCKSA